MSLRDHLQVVYDQHGQLTPGLVVDTARPKSHPLHGYVFDRKQREAADAWYKHRAHELIQSVKITYREADEDAPERSIRAYHAVRGEAGIVYKSTDDVADDPFTRQLVLRDMEREWKQLRARYEHFEEFVAMVGEDVEALTAA